MVANERLLNNKQEQEIFNSVMTEAAAEYGIKEKDYDDFSSIEILDFSEFLVDMIEIIDSNKNAEVN